MGFRKGLGWNVGCLSWLNEHQSQVTVDSVERWRFVHRV